MSPSSPDPRDRGPRLVRDAALIAVIGIGLGLTYNHAMLLAHDDRALTWVAKERSTGVLDLATPAAAGDATTPSASAPVTPTASSSAPAANTTSATTSSAPTTGTKPASHDSTHAKKSSAKKGASAKAAPVSASPAHGPIETAEGGAKTAAAPVTAAPASGGASNPAATAAGGAAAANVPAIPDTREPMEANYAVIKALHDANGAVFLDARSAEEYAAGHIPGAISMPFDDVFKKPDLAKNLDDKGKPIVTYCDGGDCELSKDLAFSLIDNGHKKVVFFKDGLPGWKSAGNPVNTGSQP
jgi:rhodanese-related sulfurtransferase